MRAIQKFVSLPFFSGCASRSSVATSTFVSTTRIRELEGVGPEVNTSVAVARREECENKTSEVKMKNPSGFLFLLPNISNGVHKLVRSLKTFSQLFGNLNFQWLLKLRLLFYTQHDFIILFHFAFFSSPSMLILS
ncbi:hypothetical protein Csa_004929 [Cucumis sativus]|nr:hypothetical protein Csa_004929 [Cucumis sativus]